MRAKPGEQIIDCDVEACRYCDCKNKLCMLEKIKIQYQEDTKSMNEIKDTVCASFKCRKEYK